uniref:SelT-like protein n=1 Tax=Populus davidiana TaxID=266767 RepID=A0A6M2ET83_9ROSI
MDRAQILLVGLPLFLLCTDLIHLFTPPPPKHPHHPHPQHHHHEQPPVVAHETPEAPTQKPVVGGIGLGSTVKIDFCSSCSYRGNAVTMKRMLETQFPGIDVVLANYPPSLPKRAVAKLVPVFQIGVVGIVLGGEQIFPMLGVRTPPWYYSLRANKFGTIASTWLLGNALQSFLQSSGAFEVYCDDELVFSKLREGRFPGEIELKDIVGRRLANSDISHMLP